MGFNFVEADAFRQPAGGFVVSGSLRFPASARPRRIKPVRWW
ncbi:hypothetical protein HMPREF9098_0753 [Kingella denitrificans ATCC 33394]|uniref:Uncharacterized protein n=1 Tax=Kingella denitrificans ATCC 33394 TaxID=888741 RepID=F0EY45_9NEIS|nr:hypothetical protein HMPREF9098_0753 [Kingella denitrificans ATCC 33394]